MALHLHKAGRDVPPRLSFALPTRADIPGTLYPWTDVQLPVDIVLLTVEECEFLACYAYLKNAFRSYHRELGFVYFGTIGESGEDALKVGLVRSYRGSSAPGGSLTTVKATVVHLRPKAAFSVGSCMGLDPEVTKLGDVVASSKLVTAGLTAAGKIGNLISTISSGWNPPLIDPVLVGPAVHTWGSIFSGSLDSDFARQQLQPMPEPMAVEMEGEGLFAAAHDLNIQWLIVKGISHFPDDRYAPVEHWKIFASVMAASLVSHMLSDPVVFKEWPHFQDLTPASVRARGEKALAAYHRALRTGGSTYDKRVKILLVGQDRVGKTSLGKALRGLPFDKDEESTEGVQMIPAIKNAGIKAWRNPASLERITAFDHKIAIKAARELLSPQPEHVLPEVEDENRAAPRADEIRQQEEDPREFKKGKHSQKNQKKDFENQKKPSGVPDEIAIVLEEHLKKNEAGTDEKIWPIIWDFAGQDIFRAIHPIFMSPDDIYLLVFDLTKKLCEKAECRVNVSHKEHTVTARDSEDTNLDHLLRWMDLIHSLKKGNQKEKESISYPPVMLVGTHADCVDDPSKEMELVKQKCKRVFGNQSYLPHIRYLLSIDNTKAGKSFDQEEIKYFRMKILKVAEEMPHTKEVIPLQWLLVEKEVSQPEWQRQKFLLKESFRENIVLPHYIYESDDEFEELVHFLHSRGTIVYHEHEKVGLVILDPQWLIKIFCKIINVTPQENDPWCIETDREELAGKGILSERLIDYTCRDESVSSIKGHLISLMSKFNLICECHQKPGESRILVPCMLRTTTNKDEKNGTGSSVPVYLTFQTEYVPSGLFSRLIVLFVRNPQHTNMYDLTSNKAEFVFDKNNNHLFQMECYKRVIKLGFEKADGSLPQEHYEYVISQLNTFLEKLQRECHWLESMSVELCARCTICIGTETDLCARHEKRFCRNHDCGHFIPLDGRGLCCKPGRMLEKKPFKPWIKAIKHVSKRSNPSSLLFKTHQSGPLPEKKKLKRDEEVKMAEEIKGGVVAPDDLEGLSLALGTWWEPLARRLEFSTEEIEEFDGETKLSKKCFRMLCRWKQKSFSGATYKVLHEALCHNFVDRKDLAGQFCICKTTEKSETKKEDSSPE